MEENQVIQDDDQEQLPPDASDDDLTLEELEKVNDDDFEKYHTGEVTGTQLREKYGMTEETEDDDDSEEDDDDETSDDDSEDDETSDDEDEQQVSYEDIWKEISQPFKANGKMYQPKDAKDVVSLMQKGVNYTQKMQQIAPFRKVAESLRSNNIDENELNFLIDLHNGNKDAIQSLLKRNKINSLDWNYDADAPDTYVPKDNMVSDNQVALSEIVSDIEHNKDKIYDIIYNKWDVESRQAFAKHPELLRLLNQEIELGRFEEIQQQLEQDKMFGRTQGMSDLDAYSNLAAQYEQYQRQQQQHAFQQQEQVRQVANKKAAAPSGRTTNTGKGKSFTPQDILSMPEEDFMKLDLDKMLAK